MPGNWSYDFLRIFTLFHFDYTHEQLFFFLEKYKILLSNNFYQKTSYKDTLYCVRDALK